MYSYNRRDVVAGSHHCGRHYATESRRRHNRHSSFSIMKWFRRNKNYDDDSAWFRDDLQRIQQAYVEQQEPDYAAVTPIIARRKPMAASWSRWSGSTTTVYSFAYVDGGSNYSGRDDDVVEYIDAATLPVARRRPDRGQCSSSIPASAATLNRTGTMTMTVRRRNKRVAPPPPAVAVAGPSSSSVVETAKMTTQRRTATIGRKKYRAPQPPVSQASAVAESHPHPQPQHAPDRHPTVAVQQRRRRNKGPAPKPPVQQQKPATEPEIGSNVKRKISQYERDRLMQRVDKIQKHFFDKEAKAKVVVERHDVKPQQTKPTITNSRQGFASVAELYTAMAATNLTELDKRAAEICRRNRLQGMVTIATTVTATTIAGTTTITTTAAAVTTTAAAAVTTTATAAVTTVSQSLAVITADHKNAIVAALMRKSYPTTVAPAVDRIRPRTIWSLPSGTTATATSTVTATAKANGTLLSIRKPVEADDETQLVRHKRLAFFQQRANVFDTRQTDSSGGSKCSSGTQTIRRTRAVPLKIASKAAVESTIVAVTVVEREGECSSAGETVYTE